MCEEVGGIHSFTGVAWHFFFMAKIKFINIAVRVEGFQRFSFLPQKVVFCFFLAHSPVVPLRC